MVKYLDVKYTDRDLYFLSFFSFIELTIYSCIYSNSLIRLIQSLLHNSMSWTHSSAPRCVSSVVNVHAVGERDIEIIDWRALPSGHRGHNIVVFIETKPRSLHYCRSTNTCHSSSYKEAFAM